MRQIVRWVRRWSDLILSVALVFFGIYVMTQRPCGVDAVAAATLGGALFGGAAILLGNCINRINELHKANEELAQRIEKLKTLIAVELVDMVCSLIGAKRIMDAAITTVQNEGSISPLDTREYSPRSMPFINSLGVELLILEKPAIDALTTLLSNLAITRQAMVSNNNHFGLLRATTLSNFLGHNMSNLSDAFKYIAPERRLQLSPDSEPES